MDKSTVYNGLWGVVAGDMLGLKNSTIPKKDMIPVSDIEASYFGPAGTWSDDSSMTLCLAESLTTRRGYDINHVAERFLKWYEQGYMTPNGIAIDIGNTTRKAMENLRKGISPYQSGLNSEFDNGNGSLMRMISLIFLTDSMPLHDALIISNEVSSITHAHKRTLLACAFYLMLGRFLLKGETKMLAYKKACEEFTKIYHNHHEISHFERILDGSISQLLEDQILSSGYSIHSLEAAVWSFLNGKNCEEIMLAAVNLGEDADSVGAITGGLAGLYYRDVPRIWIDRTINKPLVEKVIDNFMNFIAH